MFEVCVDKLCRWITLFGGRASGKSWTVGFCIMIISLLDKRFIVLARMYKDDVTYSIWKNIVSKIYDFDLGCYFKITAEKIICNLTGSEIIPFGLVDNPDKIKSLEDCDMLVVEEAAKVPKYVWDKVIPTIRKRGASIVTIFNPDWILDETYKRFVSNYKELNVDGVFIRHINYLDNSFCDVSVIREAEREKERDFESYEHIWLGKPMTTAKRQIFNGCYEVTLFDPNDFEFNPNNPGYKGALQYYFGVQFGYAQKPFAGVAIFEYDDCLYIYDSVGGIGYDINQMSDALIELSNISGQKVRCDYSLPATLKSVRRTSKLRIIESYTWQSEDVDKIIYLRSQYKKIIINPSCVDVIADFDSYWWAFDDKENKILPVPVDENNQYINAICHALCRKIKRA